MIRTITENEMVEMFKTLAPVGSCLLKVDGKYFGYDGHTQHPESTFSDVKHAHVFSSKNDVKSVLAWFPFETYEMIELNPSPKGEERIPNGTEVKEIFGKKRTLKIVDAIEQDNKWDYGKFLYRFEGLTDTRFGLYEKEFYVRSKDM